MKRSQQTVTEPSHPDAVATELVGGDVGPSSLPITPLAPGGGLGKIRKKVGATSLVRGIIGLAVFIGVWQVATSLDEWVGFSVPFVARLPAPSAVLDAFTGLVGSSGFWQSAYLSFLRVMWGFVAAMVIGIPFGLLMAVSRTAKAICFPPFEILRPIPPLAWVPAAIIFWPTQELSITFVTFLGAFFTVVINTVGGAEQIDRRFLLAARSMGASKRTIFRRVLLPATLPSIATGAVVGMGITWQVVVAAEMISGGGQGGSTGEGGGLGFLIWNSYLGGAIPQVVVGMIALGLAGYASSTLVRMLSTKLMPWNRAT
jgi:NitT/TauT family transport system permease protein